MFTKILDRAQVLLDAPYSCMVTAALVGAFSCVVAAPLEDALESTRNYASCVDRKALCAEQTRKLRAVERRSHYQSPTAVLHQVKLMVWENRECQCDGADLRKMEAEIELGLAMHLAKTNRSREECRSIEKAGKFAKSVASLGEAGGMCLKQLLRCQPTDEQCKEIAKRSDSCTASDLGRIIRDASDHWASTKRAYLAWLATQFSETGSWPGYVDPSQWARFGDTGADMAFDRYAAARNTYMEWLDRFDEDQPRKFPTPLVATLQVSEECGVHEWIAESEAGAVTYSRVACLIANAGVQAVSYRCRALAYDTAGLALKSEEAEPGTIEGSARNILTVDLHGIDYETLGYVELVCEGQEGG